MSFDSVYDRDVRDQQVPQRRQQVAQPQKITFGVVRDGPGPSANSFKASEDDAEDEDDNTFEPPVLSSYAMSLLNELNQKKTHHHHADDTDKPAERQFDFQPRLSLGTTAHQEPTGITVDSKRTSVGYNNTATPYTAFMGNDDDKNDVPMENSPLCDDKKKRPQVHFQPSATPSTPITVGVHKRLPALSASKLNVLDPSKFARLQRKHGKVNLGQPVRLSRFEVLEDANAIEQERRKLHERNQETMQWLAKLDPNSDKNDSAVDKENAASRQTVKPCGDQVPADRRKVLSSISTNTVDKSPSDVEIVALQKPHEPPVVSQYHGSRPSMIHVNHTAYERLEIIGKGGSSKVYKARSTSNGKVYAIKRVTFDEFDESAINGFKGEIDLLQKLRSEQRVVKLMDYSLSEGSLLVVMECGDIDLAHVLSSRIHMPLDLQFVRYHMCEMLKCVQAVHAAGIVHSDLKPANFLFVKGVLKIIDFGIANALTDQTMNVYRESQIGTPNYMSPESLLEANPVVQQRQAQEQHHQSMWKVGRPSDVWSCGCIIYQMVYGKPPYASYSGNQRLLAIMNPQVKIQFPDTGLGGVPVPRTVIDLIQSCLRREPHSRCTVEDALKSEFCAPRIVSRDFIEDLVNNAIGFGVRHGEISKESLQILTDEVWTKIEGLNL